VRNIIFDAINEEDVDLIAHAVIQSGVPFIAVDPGLFTAALARKLIRKPSLADDDKAAGKIFVAVGSVNAVARRQVEFFLASQHVYNVYMETAEFLESPQRRDAEIDRVAGEILAASAEYELCSVVGHGIIPEYRAPFEPYVERNLYSVDDLSKIINSAIAEITCRIMFSDKGFRAMYTCGGDIAVAVCERMGNVGLKLLGEVLPLAAYGELVGGDGDGLKIVTKGGMVGDNDAIVSCVRYLKQKLSI
jgi:uncharacterized protein YgbK (DUF1537 family)